MARPFYPHEADDYDLDQLVSNFVRIRPDFIPVEVSELPMVLLPLGEPSPDDQSPDVLQKSDKPDSRS